MKVFSYKDMTSKELYRHAAFADLTESERHNAVEKALQFQSDSPGVDIPFASIKVGCRE